MPRKPTKKKEAVVLEKIEVGDSVQTSTVQSPTQKEASVDIKTEKTNDVKLNIGDEGFVCPGIPQEPWLADPIEITGVLSSVIKGNLQIIYKVKFTNFMNVLVKLEIPRLDIYLNFTKVLAALVNAGYRFDVTNPEALRAIQRHLAMLRVNPEVLKKAISEAETEKANMTKLGKVN